MYIESLVEYMQYLKELGYEGFSVSQSQLNTSAETINFENDKQLPLKNIQLAVSECSKCRLNRTRTHTVPGEGNHSAAIMFVGEAPGYDEDQQGRPFVGRAGKLLTGIINAMGLRREDVFIANIIKCRPPENRTPQEDEISACSSYLYRQIDIIRPKIIITLGRYSTTFILGVDHPVKISELRGKFFDYKGIKVMPTFHPAYLLRNGKDKRLVWDDMKHVLSELGLHIPINTNRR